MADHDFENQTQQKQTNNVPANITGDRGKLSHVTLIAVNVFQGSF